MEGDQEFEGIAPPQHQAPYLVYAHDDGRCSITGGEVYRGKLMTALDGVYIYGDYCTGEIFAVQPTDDGPLVRTLDVTAGPNSLVSFGHDDDGEIYVIEMTGLISRLQPQIVELEGE